MKMRITPKFNVREIIDTTIRKDWFLFQNQVHQTGIAITAYMQNYINSRRKRRGNSGNLASSITFEPFTSTPATIGWGIGNINILNQKAKYWYVVNYGKTVGGQPFIPAKGKFIPGSFEGNAPSSALKTGVQKFNYNDGSNMGMFAKTPIRPLNYIQATRARFNRDLVRLISRLKKGL